MTSPTTADEGLERQRRRPEPRFTTSLAGVGVGLAVFGVLVWGGDYLEPGIDGGGADNRELGVILSLAVVAVGFGLAIRHRRGPLCTAGVVASALGVPVLLGFLTWDSGRAGSDVDAFTRPVSLNIVVFVSLLVWVASYLLVPGARGHAFLLGLAAVVLWLYVLEKTEHVVSLVPFYFLFGFLFAEDTPETDWATVAVISLVFGAAYYVGVAMIERRGRHGMATPLVAAAFPATVVGIVAFADDGDALGVGSLFVVVGAVLCAWAATGPSRRFTTWAWALGVGVGTVLIVGDLFDDNAAGGGATLVVLGTLLVLAAHALRLRTGEPDDMTPGSSRYELAPAPPPPPPPVPPSGPDPGWYTPPPGSGYPPPPDPPA